MDIEAILEEIEAPETSVTLCLKGSLVAEWERLSDQLDAAGAPVSLAGEVSDIAQRMDDLRAQMIKFQATFRFRALPPKEFSDYRTRAPERVEGQPDAAEFDDAYHDWVCGLVAASCAEPVMRPDQVDALSQKLSDNQWVRLRNHAWLVNAGKQDIPFSAAASVLIRTSDGKSRRPEPPESPEAGSLAGNPSSEPSTNTTSTGD